MKSFLIGLLLLAGVTAHGQPSHAQAEEADIEKEVKKLESGSPIEQQQAVNLLARSGRHAVLPLLEIINTHKDQMARGRAANALQSILKTPDNRDARMLDSLEALTKSRERESADLGMRLAAEFKGEPKARQLLRSAARSSSDAGNRAKALGYLIVNAERDRSETTFLKEFLADPSDQVRIQVAGYLGSLGDSSGLDACLGVLNQEPLNEKTRALQRLAAIAAGRIGSARALVPLKKIASSDTYGQAQWEAMLAIKAIELRGFITSDEKLSYLAQALGTTLYARWATYQLQELADRKAAITVLKQVAVAKDNPGAAEARKALIRMGETS